MSSPRENTLLHRLHVLRSPRRLEDALSQVDINARNPEGMTPLYIAAKEGLEGAAKRLIAAGADIDARDDNGNTPLEGACVRGYLGTVSVLLAAGAPATPGLKMAVRFATANFPETDAIIDRLITAGADVDARLESPTEGSPTLLQWACFTGHFPTVRRLLRAGASVDAVTASRHRTVLHSLCLGRRIETPNGLEALNAVLAAGADINARNTRGETPLNMIIGTGKPASLSLITYLIKVGADVNTRNNAGLTPMDKAIDGAFTSERYAIALWQHGGEVNKSLLEKARQRGYTQLLEMVAADRRAGRAESEIASASACAGGPAPSL